MINHSHPEKEERESTPAVFLCDHALRGQLRDLREQPGWSNNTIAQRIGSSSTAVSQYLNDAGCIYPGDISRLEEKFNDLLANEARRRASDVKTVKSNETEEVRVALEYIRKTTDIGVLIHLSGGGKTRGEELYAEQNPTAILYHCYAWACSKGDAQNFMFRKAGMNGYDNRTPRAVHAVTKLRGSQRLIIVDDAHFLHHTALQWWVHFHEATQMPLALCGIPELLKKIEGDAQIFSRVGLRYDIRGGDADTLKADGDLLKHMIKQLAPEAANSDELVTLCEQVAREHGHYRSVHKQLKLAVEIRQGNAKRNLTYADAFRQAHTMLFRNYNLS